MKKKKKLKYAALCIGINNYINNIILSCAVNDAEAIASAFADLHYDVFKLIDKDATIEQYSNVLEKILEQDFSKHYDAIILFFAGHGFATDNKDCLALRDCAKLEYHGGISAIVKSISVQDYIDTFRRSGVPNIIIILDACRTDLSNYADMPERGLYKNSIDFGKHTQVPSRVFIAYSTSVNSGASDIGGTSGHSKYTAALLEEIKKELPIETIFKNVRNKIHQNEGDQLPWEYTCLTSDFYFNYGQLDPYYDAEYSKEAFICIDYIGSDEIFKKILAGLSSESSLSTQLTKDLLLANKETLTDDDLFVLGRRIYSMATRNQDVYTQFMTVQTLKSFDNGTTNHLLRGIYYEIYFDEDDNPRTKLLGNSDMLTYIDRLRTLYKQVDATKFVKKYVEVKNGHPLYELWNLASSINIEIIMEDMCCIDKQDNGIYGVKKVIVNGENILDKLQENVVGVLDRDQFRKQIAENLSVPLQRLKIKGLEKDLENNKRFILCYFDNFAQQLLDTINTNLPDEVICLSSNSIVDDLYDVGICNIYYEGNEISIEGSCWVEVHLEFDGDDMGNRDFPCEFKVKSYHDYTTQIYTIKDGLFRVNTDSFYESPN